MDFGPADVRFESGKKVLVYPSQAVRGHTYKFDFESSQTRTGNQNADYYCCSECKEEQKILRKLCTSRSVTNSRENDGAGCENLASNCNS